jgi:hypothetical protein
MLSSCNDKQLARDAVGTWKMEIETEDGIEETYFVFHEDGTLEETCYFHQTETEDDFSVVINYKSTIQGTWKVFWDDLELSHELSSLDVTYVGMEFPGYSQMEEDIASAFADAFSEDEIESDKNDLIEVLQEYYGEDSRFLNLQIKDNTMSMETSDVGVVQLEKQTDDQ